MVMDLATPFGAELGDFASASVFKEPTSPPTTSSTPATFGGRNLSSAQFGDHLESVGGSLVHSTPKGFSAFGTEHPADLALGRARRYQMMRQIGKGQRPTGEQMATAAAGQVQSGKMGF